MDFIADIEGALSSDDPLANVLPIFGARANVQTKDVCARGLKSVLDQDFDLFVAASKKCLAQNIEWFDSQLWSTLINKMVDQVLARGADYYTPLFTYVRKMSHPNAHAHFQIDAPGKVYWETIRTIADHPNGAAFLIMVAATKGPVRHWFDDLNQKMSWGEKLSDNANDTVINKWLFGDLPQNQVTDLLLDWRLRKSSVHSQTVPWKKLGPSTLSDRNVSLLLRGGMFVPTDIMFSLPHRSNPLGLLEQIKQNTSSDFLSRLRTNYLMLLSKSPNVLASNWDLLTGNDKWLETFDFSSCSGALIENALLPKNKSLVMSEHKTNARDLKPIMLSALNQAGAQKYGQNDRWIGLMKGFYNTGLLPYAALLSLTVPIEDKILRYQALANEIPDFKVWAVFDRCVDMSEFSAALADTSGNKNTSTLEEYFAVFLVESLKSSPLHFQSLVEHGAVPQKMNKYMQLRLMEAFVRGLSWDDQTSQKLHWFSSVIKKCPQQMTNLVCVRDICLNAYTLHIKASVGDLPGLLTGSSTDVQQQLRTIVQGTSLDDFPSSVASHHTQLLEKFMLLEATDFYKTDLPRTKQRKI